MIETIDFSSYIIIVYIGRKRVAIVQAVIISSICCNKGLNTLKETMVEATPIKSSGYTPLVLSDVRATFHT